jgi:hypothetical protein
MRVSWRSLGEIDLMEAGFERVLSAYSVEKLCEKAVSWPEVFD